MVCSVTMFQMLKMLHFLLSLPPKTSKPLLATHDSNTGAKNLEEHLIVIQKVRVRVPVLLSDSIVFGLNCFMSCKKRLQRCRRHRLVVVSNKYIDVSGNFDEAILNVPKSIDYVLLKKSFEKPGLSWRSSWFNLSRSKRLRSLYLDFFGLFWCFMRAAFFNND